MTIHERLASFDPSEITVQWLHESMTRIKSTKRHSEVTFATNQIAPGDVVGDAMKPCIILWIDPKAMERVRQGGNNKPVLDEATVLQRAERAEAVCRDLDELQKFYAENAMDPNGMPGNEFYSEKAMVIVRKARAVLASQKPAAEAGPSAPKEAEVQP